MTMKEITASFTLFIVLFWLTCIASWTINIVKLFDCDFEAPYKAEFIRAVGIPIAPVGAIVGFMDIEDGRNK